MGYAVLCECMYMFARFINCYCVVRHIVDSYPPLHAHLETLLGEAAGEEGFATSGGSKKIPTDMQACVMTVRKEDATVTEEGTTEIEKRLLVVAEQLLEHEEVAKSKQMIRNASEVCSALTAFSVRYVRYRRQCTCTCCAVT